MSTKTMALFFLILGQTVLGYEFTRQFPDEENVQLDLFFSWSDQKKDSLEEIVLADLYYTIAYQLTFEEESNVEMVPYISQIVHTNRIDQPYEFRLARVEKIEYPNVRSFWQKLLDLSRIGPTREEFDTAKEKLKRILGKLQQHAKNVQSFIKRYQQILDDITSKEIEDDFSCIWVFNPPEVNYKVNPFSLTLAAYSQSPRIMLASSLEGFMFNISEVDKEHIYEIIHTMGTNGLFSLLRKKNHLQNLGKKIYHVEPLQLLAYIVTNPILKEDMREVERNPFKWINFIDGLSKPILKQWKEGDLQSQLPGFAHFVGKDHKDLQKYLEKGKVDEFVVELIR